MSVPSPASRLARAVSVCVLLAGVSTANAANYSILDLGTYGGGSIRNAAGVDNAGRVAGTYFNQGDADFRAYRTAANAPIDAASNLGTLDNADPYLASWANGISPTGGYVAGYSWTAVDTRPFRVDANGTMTDLGTLGGIEGEARAVNASGVAVGFSQDANGAPRAFRQSGTGAMENLGTFTGGTESFANGINASGVIVGTSDRYFSFTNVTATRAFRLPAGQASLQTVDDLGTLGGRDSGAAAINSAGQVVGTSQLLGNNATVAFRTAPNADIALLDSLGTLGGTNSYALSINDLGQVVGTSDIAGGGRHAFFVDVTGGMIDLNTLIPAGSGWVLQSATGINASGRISGTGTYLGERRAFLLSVAVPEPTTLAALAGVAIVALRRGRA